MESSELHCVFIIKINKKYVKFRVLADYRAIFEKQKIHYNLSFGPLKYCHYMPNFLIFSKNVIRIIS